VQYVARDMSVDHTASPLRKGSSLGPGPPATRPTKERCAGRTRISAAPRQLYPRRQSLRRQLYPRHQYLLPLQRRRRLVPTRQKRRDFGVPRCFRGRLRLVFAVARRCKHGCDGNRARLFKFPALAISRP
jgi:hypothetical protein